MRPRIPLSVVTCGLLWGCSFSAVELETAYVTGRVQVNRPGGVVANGSDQARLSVEVFDSTGKIIPGVQINVAAIELASGSVASPGGTPVASPAGGKANDYGYFETFLTSDTAGTFRVTVEVELSGGNVTLAEQPLVYFVTAASGVVLFQGPQTLTLPGPSESMAVADFDSDSYADVALTRVGVNSIAVYGGADDGLSLDPDQITGIDAPRSLSLWKHPQEGHGLLAFDDNTNTVVQLAPPELNVVDTLQVPTDKVPSRAEMADLDGDGELDIVVFERESHSLTILPSGDDSNSQHYVLADGAEMFTVAHCNADDDLDIVVAQATVVRCYPGTAEWPDPVAESPRDVSTLTALASGDIDGDGRVEWLWATTDGSITVSNGQTETVISSSTTAPALGLVAADLTGDGLLDITALRAPTANVNTVYAYLQTLPPTSSGFAFFEIKPRGTLNTPSHLGVGDLNADGAADIVVSSSVVPGLLVLLGL